MSKLGGFDFYAPGRQAGVLSAMSNEKNALPPLLNQKFSRRNFKLQHERNGSFRNFKNSAKKGDYNDGKNIGWGVIEYPDPVMIHG